MLKNYNLATGEALNFVNLPPDLSSRSRDILLPDPAPLVHGGGGYGGGSDDDSTSEEEVGRDYEEQIKLFGGGYENGALFEFKSANNGNLSNKERYDNDVVTPFLFGKFIGGALSMDDVKHFGSLSERRKLYRKLTDIFQ